MGGQKSKFAETDWTQVDGGLNDSQCLVPTPWLGKWWGSGDDPASGTTATPVEFLLKARFTSWSGHDFDIKDSGGKLMFTVKGKVSLKSVIDILSAKGEKLCRIQRVWKTARWWEILVYTGGPFYEGQVRTRLHDHDESARQLMRAASQRSLRTRAAAGHRPPPIPRPMLSCARLTGELWHGT